MSAAKKLYFSFAWHRFLFPRGIEPDDLFGKSGTRKPQVHGFKKHPTVVEEMSAAQIPIVGMIHSCLLTLLILEILSKCILIIQEGYSIASKIWVRRAGACSFYQCMSMHVPNTHQRICPGSPKINCGLMLE